MTYYRGRIHPNPEYPRSPDRLAIPVSIRPVLSNLDIIEQQTGYDTVVQLYTHALSVLRRFRDFRVQKMNQNHSHILAQKVHMNFPETLMIKTHVIDCHCLDLRKWIYTNIPMG